MHSFVSLFCFLKGVNQPIKKKKKENKHLLMYLHRLQQHRKNRLLKHHYKHWLTGTQLVVFNREATRILYACLQSLAISAELTRDKKVQQ